MKRNLRHWPRRFCPLAKFDNSVENCNVGAIKAIGLLQVSRLIITYNAEDKCRRIVDLMAQVTVQMAELLFLY